MKAITFLLTTKQPILATSFQGDPNSDVSYSYIPGSMIRGALIGRYLNRYQPQNADILTDEKVRHLFFDDSTYYLNAYISSQEEKRTYPTLISWRREKDNESEIFDFSVDKTKLESPKAVGDGFWIEEEGYIKLYPVDRRLNIHNLRERSKGRSTQNEGEIFRYDAIDKGQNFQGVILCNDCDEKIIRDLLTPLDIWLGGSRSSGYGHIQISQIHSYDSWNEVGISPESRVGSNTMKVTLLSDLIIRDKQGQYTVIPPTDLLSEELGIHLDEPVNTFMSSTFIGGFNRKWGLPLPQILAIKAGSVFVYENICINSDQIFSLEEKGLGERKSEGFGRIAINWHSKKRLIAKKVEIKLLTRPKDKKPQFETPESRELAIKIGERILRRRLEQLLLEKIEQYKLETNKMTNNQLSRLIIVARQALDQNSREPLDTLFNQLTKDTRIKYEGTKLGSHSLQKTIQEWLDSPRKWMGTEIQNISIDDVTYTLTDSICMEYTLRLIMTIAKNATKEKDNE